MKQFSGKKAPFDRCNQYLSNEPYTCWYLKMGRIFQTQPGPAKAVFAVVYLPQSTTIVGKLTIFGGTGDLVNFELQ